MGTPDFAVPTLSELLGAGHDIAAVYTQPPRAAGRGQKSRPGPVQSFAEEAGLSVRTPLSLRDGDAQSAFAALDADVAIVVAYGLILPRAILEAPAHGCLNLHGSLLPRWRGAAPIQRAIMAGDAESGIAVMRMEEGLDTGPVCLVDRVAIEPNMTAGQLHDRLATLGADLMVRALAALERDSLDCTPQPDEGATYAEKIDKREARIDWSRPAAEVHNLIRGLSPFPGAWFEHAHDGKPERIKVLRSEPVPGEGTPGELLDDQLTVACETGALRLVQVQRAGKSPMAADAFLRGFPLSKGMQIT